MTFTKLRLLEIAGEALYGAGRWQQALAVDIGISPRTMRRWIAGEGEPTKDAIERATQRVLLRSRVLKSTHITLARYRDKLPDEA